MAKLVLSQDGVVTREFVVTDSILTIGRKAQNDIQIEDISVSGSHARVLVEQNFYMETLKDVYIEDTGSTNGTYVNGAKIKKHMLRHGDVIQIGRHDFKFMDDDAPDFDKTVVISPGAAQESKPDSPQIADTEQKNPSPELKEQPAAVSKEAFVKVLTGPKAGKELALVKSYTSMGNAGTMIVIAKRQQGFYVSHVTGKSEQQGKFPSVNGNPVGAQSVPLNDKDLIDIDGLKLEFIVR